MKLDLIFIAEQLPNSFMPSIMNRLSPKTYINLRRTCSYMNDTAENAVDRNTLRVRIKNRNLHLEFMRTDNRIRITVGYSGECFEFHDQTVYDLPDADCLYGFSYKTISIRYDGNLSELTNDEVYEVSNGISYILTHLGFDNLRVLNYSDFAPFFVFLYAYTEANNTQNQWLAIGEKQSVWNSGKLLPVSLGILIDPVIQQFARLSVHNCALDIHNFNLLDLCKDRQYLKLRFTDEWDAIKPMYTRFIEDIHNGADLGPLRRFKFEFPYPPQWDRSPSNVFQFGNISFSHLVGPSKKWSLPGPIYTRHTRTKMYYSETNSLKLLLDVRYYNGFTLDLYIMPSNDLSSLVQHLISLRFEKMQVYWRHPVPMDNSRLYSLLEEATVDQYADIIDNYMDDIMGFMYKKNNV